MGSSNLSSLTDLIKKGGSGLKINEDKKPELTIHQTEPQVEISNTTEEEKEQLKFGFTNLADWWISNKHHHAPTFKSLSINAPGLDQRECLIFVKPDPAGGKDNEGNDKIILVPFQGADNSVVLNHSAVGFNIFSNGFMMVHEIDDNNFLTTYGSKTSINIFECVRIDDLIIPYRSLKIKNRSSSFIPISINKEIIENKLTETIDQEIAVIMYKQVAKYWDSLKTNLDIIKWFSERKAEIVDVNHLNQIDQTIVELLKINN